MKLDDFHVGQIFTTPAVTLTREDILAFAQRYDPQYFHVDADAARTGPFGGLIASGFHTLTAVWVEWIKMDILGRDCLGGMGMDHVVWKVPVVPDDSLHGRLTVLKTRRLNADVGILTLGIEVFNQHDAKVMACDSVIQIRA
jgi:acyl dehydratase